jgi:molybdopterin converting factor subunit 1
VNITVRFFASYADKVGITNTSLTVAPGASVSDLLETVALLPGADSLPHNPRIAVNQVFASRETVLSAGDEVAFIPPVAGG